jgi:hypothetical protein
LSDKIRALREARSSRRGIWNFFRRRRVTAEINVYRQDRRALRARMEQISDEIRLRMSQDLPEYEGLNVAAKRSINLTVIAYAQELFLHFGDRDVANSAREASIRQLLDVSYGSKRDCRAMSKYLEDRMKLLGADSKLQARVQVRARLLAELVSYRQDADTVPSAVTVGSILLLKADGRQRGEIDINVLGDEYWDVFSTLQI